MVPKAGQGSGSGVLPVFLKDKPGNQCESGFEIW